MKQPLKELTRAEEEVMHHLWELQKGFVKDILERFPEPKPAYNTVSTLVRILEKKGFVSHEPFGKSHRYFPVVSKEAYAHYAANQLLSGYFSGSLGRMMSFFAKRENLSPKDLEEIQNMLNQTKNP